MGEGYSGRQNGNYKSPKGGNKLGVFDTRKACVTREGARKTLVGAEVWELGKDLMETVRNVDAIHNTGG